MALSSQKSTPVLLILVFKSPVTMVKVGGIAQALMLPEYSPLIFVARVTAQAASSGRGGG